MNAAPMRFFFVAALLITMSSNSLASKYFLYVGTYGKGVYAYRLDSNSPTKLEPLGLSGDVTNPSFLTADPQFRYLYAVSELEGNVDGAVAAFSIDRKTGALHFLNSASSNGVAPCHLAVDHTAKLLAVANYGTGGVAVFPIQGEGHLGSMSELLTAKGSSVNPKRQEGPHAHEVVISADNRFAYVPDLGLDEIRLYRIDPENAKLGPTDPPFVKVQPGSGPRHLAFSPDGKYAYLIHELESFVTVFARNSENGVLLPLQKVSTLPAGFKGENGPAEVAVDKAGKFVYASNRGPGTIAVFAVNRGDGKLNQIQVAETGGTFPRAFEFDPTGRFLLVGDQKANRFVIFSIDPTTGKLSLTVNKFEVSSPVSFLFVPAE
ncbi:MAG: lactonase family protein [Acidobacteriaceae bacterium]|nr:lactonase family protein [Acidobacteriaceae bacterium]